MTKAQTSRPVSPRPTLLLVDDDPLIVDALAFSLGPHFSISTASTRPQALQILERLGHAPEIALVDLGLPPLPHRPDEGFALIQEIVRRAPQTRILVLSGQSDEANGRHARALGAVEFITKPCDPGSILSYMQRVLALGEPLTPPQRGLLGDSAAVQKLRAQLRQFADSPFPVLIDGESGSGKEIIAHEHLHNGSLRAGRPFLALNCAAIPPGLVEPTLFGHAKGSFTGATGSHAGYFEEVGDGTLFLDEIGELPLDVQAKLLRVLENGEYQRVGDTQTRRSRARIVAATNRDLREEVRAARFRIDLFHRLSILTVSAPALRDMGKDREILLDHFRAQFAAQTGQEAFVLDEQAQQLWLRYRFPGNVRELRNIVIRLGTRYAGKTVSEAALADELDLPDTMPQDGDGKATPHDMVRELEEWQARARQLLAKTSVGGRDFNLDAFLKTLDRSFIDAALDIAGGNVSHAARLLGISRTTLYSRMENRMASKDRT